MLEIHNLHKSFGKLEVLQGINLQYGQNMIYGLVGENGAGKTTLFNCITSLYPYKGNIIKENGLKTGYLPATNFFYSQITGLEYIEFCLKAKGIRIDKNVISSWNQTFQLPLERYASTYSTGMKKKLAFMALLIQDNDIYILDEPFNGVDLNGCIQIKRFIRELKNKGKTIILSSHLIASLHEISDTIHYLKNGIIYKTYQGETITEIETDILKS